MYARKLAATAALAVAAALSLTGSAGATDYEAPPDFGAPPGPPQADCDGHEIDPPFEVIVTADVTIDGQGFATDSVTYGESTPGVAVFTWTADQAAALAVPGPHEVQIVYGWNIGTGQTTLIDSLTCVEPCEFNPQLPAESPECVPPPPPPTTPPVTNPPVEPPTQPPATPPVVDIGPPAEPLVTPPPTLPHTGASSWALAGIGASFIGGGLALVRRGARTSG